MYYDLQNTVKYSCVPTDTNEQMINKTKGKHETAFHREEFGLM